MKLDLQTFFREVRSSDLFGGKLTAEQVEGIEAILDEVPDGMKPEHLAYCLATVRHETGAKMVPVEENLNYSAERLCQVWPTRFSPAKARSYAHKPEAIANYVYGGRMGNGLERSGDGWKYRGRGLPQLTGRAMYRKLGAHVMADLEGKPDLALDPKIAVRILFAGMVQGLYTGKKLSDYDGPRGTFDAVKARAIVNGTDKAAVIAHYWTGFLAAIRSAMKAPAVA